MTTKKKEFCWQYKKLPWWSQPVIIFLLTNNGHHVMNLWSNRQSSGLKAKQKRKGSVFMFPKELTSGDNLLHP